MFISMLSDMWEQMGGEPLQHARTHARSHAHTSIKSIEVCPGVMETDVRGQQAH